MPKEDFIDTFLSITKFSTLQVFLAYVAYLNQDFYYVNVIATYFYSPLDEEIYIVILDSIENSGSDYYWRLKELKQAGRQWKKYLYKVLIKFGFIHAFADDCLYIKCHKERIILLILVYVDDMAVAKPDGCHIVSFKLFLDNNFEITDLDELKYMFRVLITSVRPKIKQISQLHIPKLGLR